MSNKKEIIKKLEASTIFAESSVLIKIVDFLIDAKEKGESPKSAEIAHAVLAHEREFYKDQEALIRVHVHKLRKKLELYYLSEGKNDEIKIVIPKGSYQISYIKQKSNAFESVTKKIYLGILSLLLVVIFILSYLLLREKDKNSYHTTLSSLISSMTDETQTLDIILGDKGFYSEYDKELKRRRNILDTDVNLPHRTHFFSDFIEKHPTRRIERYADVYTHSDTENFLFAYKVGKEFVKLKKEAALHISSQKDKIDHHSVFLSLMDQGDMYELSNYFYNSKFLFDDVKFRGRLMYFKKDDDSQRVKINNSKVAKDGSLVSYIIIKRIKIKEHFVLFLLPGSNMARNYLLEKLFDSSFTEEIIERYDGDVPESFELLFKVYGGRSLGLKHQIIYSSEDLIDIQLGASN